MRRRGLWDDGEECALCEYPYPMLQTDHIVPRWKGGSDKKENLQRICPNCHHLKSQAERAEFWSVHEYVPTPEAVERASIALKAMYAERDGHGPDCGHCQGGWKLPERTPEVKERMVAALRGKKHPPDCNHCKVVRSRTGGK
jgi:hypothetical protein